MKKLLCFLTAVAMVIATNILQPTMTASAATEAIKYDIEVSSYDPNVDYSQRIIDALKLGNKEHALILCKTYEAHRNAKIRLLNMKYRQSHCETLEEFAENYLPKPKTKYSAEDLDLLARLIFAESGCNWFPDWVQRATGSVVLNRVDDSRYPNNIHDVIYQSGQYGCVWNGSIYRTPTQKCINNAKYVLEHGSTLPAGVIGQSGAIQGTVYAQYYDPTLGVTTYFCY